MSRNLLPIGLIVLPLACSSEPSVVDDSEASKETSSAHAPVVSPTPSPATTPLEPDESTTPVDPSFAAYYEKVASECSPGEPMTTADMMQHASKVHHCITERIEQT